MAPIGPRPMPGFRDPLAAWSRTRPVLGPADPPPDAHALTIVSDGGAWGSDRVEMLQQVLAGIRTTRVAHAGTPPSNEFEYIYIFNSLLSRTIWLASTLRSKGTKDARMADRDPLTWAPIQLSTQRVVFDTSCMESVSETHGGYVCTAKDSVIRVESDGRLKALVNQGRLDYSLLSA